MKVLLFALFFATAAVAQNPPDAKVITFDRADTAHCRVVQASGTPLLETS